MRGDQMQGEESPGIIPLSLKEIFGELHDKHGHPLRAIYHAGGGGSHYHPQIGSGGSHYLRTSYSPKDKKLKTWIVKISYLEIYNECVNDLLDPMRKNLSVRENQ
jgi:hypothetical protein